MRRASSLVLATVLLAGCGGNGGPLDKKEYAGKADAICSKYNERTKALPTPHTISELAVVADKTLPILDRALDELRAIEPPAAERATVDRWFAQFRLLEDDLRKIRDRARAKDVPGIKAVADGAKQRSAKANELATRLGMKVCNRG